MPLPPEFPLLPGLHAPHLSPHLSPHEQGVREERACWIAWLRALAGTRPVGCGLRLTYADLAERGEAGEHRRARR